MNILVTGAAGYIGSHFTHEAIKRGFKVVAVDNLTRGKLENLPNSKYLTFYKVDLLDKDKLLEIFENNKINAIFHFAALVEVNESVRKPYLYYENNVKGSLNLIETSVEYGVNYFIFSSSAAVYGNPVYTPIDEKHPLNPESPYGSSKMLVEEILRQYSKWKGLKFVSLRYFNVVGSYYSLPTNKNGLPFALIKSLEDKKIKIFGKDYNTKDGTPLRDFIDVLDLVDAHFKAYEFLKNNNSEVFNLGSGKGYTVLEVIKEFNKLLNERNLGEIKLEFVERRKGDVEKIFCSYEKAKKLLNWFPKRKLRDSLKSLVDFYLKQKTNLRI